MCEKERKYLFRGRKNNLSRIWSKISSIEKRTNEKKIDNKNLFFCLFFVFYIYLHFSLYAFRISAFWINLLYYKKEKNKIIFIYQRIEQKNNCTIF